MTEQEFEQWFQFHSQTFNLGRWARENPMALDAWYGALRGYSVQHLNEATEELIGLSSPPKYPEQHVSAIKCFLQSKAAQTPEEDRFPKGVWVDNPEGGREYLPHCVHCTDRGHLAVYLPAAVKCFRRLPDGAKWDSGDGHYTERGEWCRHVVTVSCCCERGRANSLTKGKFDPSRMLPWHYSDLERLANPGKFLLAPVAQSMRVSDFDGPIPDFG